MTKDTISEIEALKALLSEGPDHLVLAEMLGFVADRLMALARQDKAFVIFGHCPEQWPDLRKAPDSYA